MPLEGVLVFNAMLFGFTAWIVIIFVKDSEEKNKNRRKWHWAIISVFIVIAFISVLLAIWTSLDLSL